jgi:hypothetical protein
MEAVEERWDEGAFCQAYLRTMNPERAAEEAGRQNGFAILGAEATQARLEKMRSDAAGQLRREDALRQLARLAFGQANDAVRLALRMDAADLKELDLSAVAEFKVTDKGGVEVKLVDRVRALETLCGLLECEGGRGTEALYQALTEGSGETEEAWDHG